MQGIAEFHKVSFAQFLQDSKKTGFITDETDPELVKVIWESIKLPERATGGSAGYDFFLPYPFAVNKNVAVTIPTGIKADIQPGWCLVLMPRSGLGFKYGFRLLNTLGLIDADYFFSDNEGHIMAKATTDVNVCFNEGDRFIQGVFFPHGLTRTDTVTNVRNGGFGSTGG